MLERVDSGQEEVEKEGCRTGEFRTGRMQDWRDAGKEGCGTGVMQDRRDARVEEERKGAMNNRKDGEE